jgi:hypothetical protein
MTCAVINGEIVGSVDRVDASAVSMTSTGVLAVGLGICMYRSSASSLASSSCLPNLKCAVSQMELTATFLNRSRVKCWYSGC